MKFKEIISYEKACEVLNRIPELPDLSILSEAERRYYTDHMKLTTIIAAMNKVEGDWKPDYSNRNQAKYYAWPWVAADKERPSGFGFSTSTCTFDFTHSCVGSRLCMKSAEMVLWALEQHRDLYISVLLR